MTHFGRILLAMLVCTTVGLTHPGMTPAEPDDEARLLTSTRQLTFAGRRAGEGYFSADGKRMIFQSEREPGNPFYQIYLMDLETGDTRRVSPGIGKTTCAWIHPHADKVFFASTHADPQARATDSPRPPSKKCSCRRSTTRRSRRHGSRLGCGGPNDCGRVPRT